MQAHSFSAVDQEVMLARVIVEAALSTSQRLASDYHAAAQEDGASAAGAGGGRGALGRGEAGSGGPFAEIGGSPPLSVSLSDPLFRPRQGTHVLTVRLCKAAPGLHVVQRPFNPAATSASTSVGAIAGNPAGPRSSPSASASSLLLPSRRHVDATGASGYASATATPATPPHHVNTRVVLVATVEAIFPAAYPSEPCTWRPSLDGVASRTALVGGLPRQPSRRGGSGEHRRQAASPSSSPLARRQAGAAPYSVAADEGPQSPGAPPAAHVAFATLQPSAVDALLGWVTRARIRPGNGVAGPDSASAAACVNGGEGPARVAVPPFLRDFTVLLKSWAALEVGLDRVVLQQQPLATPQQQQRPGESSRARRGGTNGSAASAAAPKPLSSPSSSPSSKANAGPSHQSSGEEDGGGGAMESTVGVLVSAHRPGAPPPWDTYLHAVAAAAATRRGASTPTPPPQHRQRPQHALPANTWAAARSLPAWQEARRLNADLYADHQRTAAAAKDARRPNRADHTRRAAGGGVSSSLSPAAAKAGGGPAGGASGGSMAVPAAAGTSSTAAGGSGVGGGLPATSTAVAAGGGGGVSAAASTVLPPPPGMMMLAGGAGPVGPSAVAMAGGPVGFEGQSRLRSAPGGSSAGGAGTMLNAVSGGGTTSGGAAAARSALGSDVAGCSGSSRRRSFTAVLLPQGGVLCWGRVHVANAAVRRQQTRSSGLAAETPAPSQRLLSRPPLPPHVSAFYRALVSGSRRGTALLFTSRFAPQRPLPSLVTPAAVLQSATVGPGKRCRWTDVHLHLSGDGTAHAALQANAKLCKALQLKGVTSLLATLQRLAKGLTDHTAPAYASEILAPMLEQALAALQAGRHVFWAGVAVCCLVLPGVLCSDRQSGGHGVGRVARRSAPSTFSIAPCLQDKASCIAAVSLVERVFGLVGAHTRLCEARMARIALEDAVVSAAGAAAVTAPRADGVVGRIHMPPRAVRHEPITHCAVCGLRLQRHAHPAAAGATATAKAPSPVSSPAGSPRGQMFAAAAFPAAGASASGQPVSNATSVLYSLLASPTNPDAAQDGQGRSIDGADAALLRLEPRPAAEKRWGTSANTLTNRSDDAAAGDAAAPATPTRQQMERREGDGAGPDVVEGCLVVQCLRCGHGGHVEHIAGWWKAATVRCCPKGCDCMCIY